MEENRMVFEEGDKNCPHDEWKEGNRNWEDGKSPVFSYRGNTRICKNCGREELLGGTVIALGTNDEYVLEPDGSLGGVYSV